MAALNQLVREFLIPLLLALGWTAYNLYEAPRGAQSIRDIINVFGPSFFLFSWLLAQWFRVRKQIKVDTGLARIEASVSNTLDRLEERSNFLIDHITGGDGYCRLEIVNPDYPARSILVSNSGSHPMYEVHMRIIDLEVYEEVKAQTPEYSFGNAEINLPLGTLAHSHSYIQECDLGLNSYGDVRRFNIFFNARNGSFTQLLRYRSINGGWQMGTRIDRAGNTLFEKVPDEFLS